MHRVIVDFYDMQDELHAYSAGDSFPRDGLEVSAERLAYLASDKTRLGVPVIEEIKEKRSRKTKNKG